MKYSEDKVIRMVKATQEIEGIRVSENAEKMKSLLDQDLVTAV